MYRPVGVRRNVVVVIVLSIATLGIYSLIWQYKSFKEMKAFSGDGIGGGIGLVLAIFVGIVNVFLLPNEVGDLYAKGGQPRPVSALTGFWVLIPLVGTFVWIAKVQGSLNRFWEHQGSGSGGPTSYGAYGAAGPPGAAPYGGAPYGGSPYGYPPAAPGPAGSAPWGPPQQPTPSPPGWGPPQAPAPAPGWVQPQQPAPAPGWDQPQQQRAPGWGQPQQPAPVPAPSAPAPGWGQPPAEPVQQQEPPPAWSPPT
jgi:hypothetical protein